MSVSYTHLDVYKRQEYNGQAMLRVVNRAKGQLEYIYELTTKTLDKNRKNGKDTIELLRSIDGVYRVNLVCQNEELSR